VKRICRVIIALLFRIAVVLGVVLVSQTAHAGAPWFPVKPSLNAARQTPRGIIRAASSSIADEGSAPVRGGYNGEHDQVSAVATCGSGRRPLPQWFGVQHYLETQGILFSDSPSAGIPSSRLLPTEQASSMRGVLMRC
jgi:hypothetical protein